MKEIKEITKEKTKAIKNNDISIKRKEEIVLACEKLYKKMSFRDITIKDIAKETTFTRASIYNYFETKEEIFLALYEKEYYIWNDDLEEILMSVKKFTKSSFADNIAKTLEKRVMLLKLMAMNNYDMEENSRLECLTSFKVAYLKTIATFSKLLSKFNPLLSKKDINDIIYMFYPFIYALYPYSHVTDKQMKAMELAGHKWNKNTIYKLTYNFMMRIL